MLRELITGDLFSLIFVAGNLITGLSISLVQALTQIQEMTLTFVPKIVATFVALLIFLPFMGGNLKGFMESIVERIATM